MTEPQVLRLADHAKYISKSWMNTQALDVFYSVPRESIVDFDGVTVDFYQVMALAKLLETFDHTPINMQHPDDVHLITAIQYMREPQLTFDEFVSMFEGRFPVGTVCIRDDLFSKSRKSAGKHTSVLYIEDIVNMNVRFRCYRSSAFNHQWFERGGASGYDNYSIENIDMHSLFQKQPYIRYPITQQEQESINYFFYPEEYAQL